MFDIELIIVILIKYNKKLTTYKIMKKKKYLGIIFNVTIVFF